MYRIRGMFQMKKCFGVYWINATTIFISRKYQAKLYSQCQKQNAQKPTHHRSYGCGKQYGISADHAKTNRGLVERKGNGSRLGEQDD